MDTKDTLSKPLPNSSKTFNCDQCEKVFHHLAKLRSHKRTHANPESVTCNVCKKVFAHRASLTRHKRIHTGIRPYKCPICTMRFTQGSHMRRHVELIHNSDRKKQSKTATGNKCDACGLNFKTAKGLKIHKKTHEPSKGPFNCEICAQSFEYSNQLTQHRKGHKKQCVSKVCKKSFSSTTQLSVHAVIHNGKLPYSCKYCGEKFRLKGHAKRHEMTAHMQDKRNELPESELASANERELPNSGKNTNKIDHILNPISTELHENENQLEQRSPDGTNVISKKHRAPISCNQIRKEPDKIIRQCKDPSENNQIQSDENKTTNCDSATCEISKKSDKSHSSKTESLCENPEESSMNLNIEKPKVKANQCDICFKTFKQKSYVKYHKRTHTGEKLFSCECGKSYTFAHRLRSHRKSGKCSDKPAEISDTEPAAIKCSNRKKICKSKSLLKAHEKRHEKKVEISETFQCRFCSKNFRSKDGVDKHAKTAHKGNKMYQCDLCNETFKLGAHVANHKKRFHGKGRKRGRKNKKILASFAAGGLQKCETSSPNGNSIAYDCEFCGKSFSRETQLLGHKKIHKPKESFECQTCGKHFKNWNNLHRHQLVHTGEKPFVCWVCGKACTQKSNLKSHMNRIHGISDVVMPVRSDVVSSSDQLHEIHTEVSRFNGGIKNTIREGDVLKRSTESQLGSTSQLCNEVEKDSQCITNSPGLLPSHDEDTGLTQLRPRANTERNLFTELKLRKRRHCNVDSPTEDNSNSKKYASEISNIIIDNNNNNSNNNNKDIWQKQQPQQKESGFKEGNRLEKLNAEIDRLSASFLRSENVCSRKQPFYQQSNASLQSSSKAEHESSSTRFQTEARASSSWNGSAEVFENADSSRGKFEEPEVSREVEGHHDWMFVCCECGQKFDEENIMIEHCVNAH